MRAFLYADLLVTHPTRSREGMIEKLKDHLIRQGQLVPPEQGMCMVQVGRVLPMLAVRLNLHK
jgi:hypothetical protein